MTMVKKMSNLVVLNQEDLVLRNKVLKEQMMFFSQQQNTDNPFKTTESDVGDAQFADNLISDDEKY